MRNVAVITSTRAEYGLLRPLIIRLLKDGKVCPKVVVTGAHLLEEFGMTCREIESDAGHYGFEIDEKIDIYKMLGGIDDPGIGGIVKGGNSANIESGDNSVERAMLIAGDRPVDISRVMGQALILFGEYFDRKRPDAIVVLGDRYEMLAVCSAAMNARIPIIHIHGGETTEGAVDEAIRHSITKMSLLHFTATETYRRRVIQLGEDPERVFNVGALGVENVLNVETMSAEELEENLRVELFKNAGESAALTDGMRNFHLGDRYAVGTFHPVTLEDNSARAQTQELLTAIKMHPDITWLFTKAGADAGGREVNEIFADFAKENDNFYLVDSLGMRRYLSAVKGALFVIGNSSSGIIEVPSFHVPTINIGDRQKGRIAGESVINCEPDRSSIDAAIMKALDDGFRTSIAEAENPYEKYGTSKNIAEKIEEFILQDKLEVKKHFYDIDG